MEGREEDRRHAQERKGIDKEEGGASGGRPSIGTELFCICLSHFISFIQEHSTGWNEGGCKRRTKATHREGKGSTWKRERKLEEDYQQVQGYFTFIYHTSFLLFRNTQWDGARMQEKDTGRAQDGRGVDKEEGREIGGTLSIGTGLFYICLSQLIFLIRGTQLEESLRALSNEREILLKPIHATGVHGVGKHFTNQFFVGD